MFLNNSISLSISFKQISKLIMLKTALIKSFIAAPPFESVGTAATIPIYQGRIV